MSSSSKLSAVDGFASSDDYRIGLVAGWGRYPVVMAQALQSQGYEVSCLGVKDHADPMLRELCHHYREIGLAKLGGAIRYFRRQGVQRAMMAGKIHKVLLFRRFAWLHHLPDFRCLKTFFPHFISRTRDRKDDTLLQAVVDAFASDGISFLPATFFLPELLVKFGHLAGKPLSAAGAQDVEFGWKLAKASGLCDVGQSVIVKGQAVLAIEAIEGTDACIRRAGHLCTAGGFTVVKVAKPQQDMRYDVPTVGLGTMYSMREAGAKVLAIEAGRTIIIDEAAVLDFANHHGITIVAAEESRIGELVEDQTLAASEAA